MGSGDQRTIVEGVARKKCSKRRRRRQRRLENEKKVEREQSEG